MQYHVKGREMSLVAAAGVAVTALLVSCSTSVDRGVDYAGPSALGPGGQPAGVMGPGAPPTEPPIDLSREFEAVWGSAPVHVFDTRQIQPQIQVSEPWMGIVRDVESVLEARSEKHKDGGEGKFKERQRLIEPNDLPVGGMLAEQRARPGTKFPGIQNTPWNPPDCTLAVGPNYIVETVNMTVAWYTRGGTLVFSQNLDSSGDPGFFEGIGGGSFCFDPKVFYDHIDNRFVIVALETYGTTQSWIDIAISDDEDPNGVWYKYRTNSVVTVGANTYWVDYPGWGYDKDAYYVTGNLFGLNNGGWAGVLFRTFKKPQLLGGQPAVYADIRDESAGSVQAAFHFGNNQAAYFASTEYNGSQMRVHAIKNAATTPSLVFTTVNVPSYGFSAASPPTPGGGYVDAIDDRVYNVVWRDGDMYFGHNAYTGGRNIARWYHLSTNNWPTSGNVTSVEAGNLDPGGTLHSFYPALAVDKCKNVGVVLGTCSALQNPDVRVTGRRAGDPAGTMGAMTVVQTGPNTSTGRWGDYFGAILDPTDQQTFWYVGEYRGPSGWGTYIGSFKINCAADYDCNGFVNGDDFDLFVVDFEAGLPAADYDGNGFVNGDDFDFFVVDFESGC